jgi:hypothetical protein
MTPDPRHNRRAAAAAQHQDLDCRLPCRQFGFLLRQAGDVIAGIQQRQQLAAAGQGDWILELSLPVSHRQQV